MSEPYYGSYWAGLVKYLIGHYRIAIIVFCVVWMALVAFWVN